ncbi:MAG: hypothetical protein FWF06_01810 [Symbiobacteriaceae bacterium]|nr:hypothetical protein [Symbiobacteriaceae bacterium]
MKKIGLWIICLGLLLFIPGRALAMVNEETAPQEEEEEASVVYSWEELQEWMESHRSGGKVYLGSNILIDDSTNAYIYTGYGYCEIEAGEFGFVVEGELCFYGNHNISGQGIREDGSQQPLIWVRNGGYLAFYNDMVTFSQFTVTGNGGIGILLEEDSLHHANSNAWEFHLQGDNSVAVVSAIPLYIQGIFVEASGEETAGIISSAPVHLFLANIITSHISVATPELVLDTCILEPLVAEAKVINRVISQITLVGSSRALYSLVEESNYYFVSDYLYYNIFLSAPGEFDEVFSQYLRMDDSTIDYHTPGEYWVTPIWELNYPYSYFPIIDAAKAVLLKVEVYDPTIPFFLEAGHYWGYNFYVTHLFFPGEEEPVLWYSDDDGEHWQVFWQEGEGLDDSVELYIRNYCLDFMVKNLSFFSTPTWFVYQVGEISSLAFYVDPTDLSSSGVGGDRDGSDRVQLLWYAFQSSLGENPELGKGDNQGDEGSSSGDSLGSSAASSEGRGSLPTPFSHQGVVYAAPLEFTAAPAQWEPDYLPGQGGEEKPEAAVGELGELKELGEIKETPPLAALLPEIELASNLAADESEEESEPQPAFEPPPEAPEVALNLILEPLYSTPLPDLPVAVVTPEKEATTSPATTPETTNPPPLTTSPATTPPATVAVTTPATTPPAAVVVTAPATSPATVVVTTPATIPPATVVITAPASTPATAAFIPPVVPVAAVTPLAATTGDETPSRSDLVMSRVLVIVIAVVGAISGFTIGRRWQTRQPRGK